MRTGLALLFVIQSSNVISENHWVFDHDKNEISASADSPYVIRQPHSLTDFVNQQKWIQELAEIRLSIRQQQQLIERRYAEDDPEIEDKIRKNDPNCVRSKPLDLQTEHFMVTYPIDLIRSHSEKPRNTYELGITTKTLRVEVLEKIFPTSEGKRRHREPLCQKFVQWDKSNDQDEDDDLPILVEKKLYDMIEPEKKDLAAFLSDQLEGTWQHLALYYAAYYWHLNGNAGNALHCLYRFLETEPNSMPARFQLGVLYIKLGKFKKAISFLEPITKKLRCSDCLLALGDAHVLDGNFRSAIAAFDDAHAIEAEENSAKKAALLRCILKIFEVMEHQHTNLLDTIEDVKAYRQKKVAVPMGYYNVEGSRLKRMKELEELIEKNRARPDTRVQHRWAHEHLTIGPFAHLHCQGAKFFGSSGKRLERLLCFVDNWQLYSASLAVNVDLREPNVTEADVKRRKQLQYEISRSKQPNKELEEFLGRLKPYVSLQIDEPQFARKYPLLSQSTSDDANRLWPTSDDCQRQLPQGTPAVSTRYANEADLPQMFISPENKGYSVADLLTKYLGLSGNATHPLPWELPFCPDNQPEEESETDTVFELQSVRNISESTEPMFHAEVNLKKEVAAAVGTSNTATFADVGQRIATLMKYNIGPEWISANLAVLVFRALGMSKEAVSCVKVALKAGKHNDIAYGQLAQIVLRSHRSSDGAADAEKILRRALEEDDKEPVTHFLLGVAVELQGNRSSEASNYKRTSLRLDPSFTEAKHDVFVNKCSRKQTSLRLSLTERHAPICCWPNEQNVYCFPTKANRRGTKTNCFRLEESDVTPGKVHFSYYRCNAVYTGKSYKPPALANIIAPLLEPMRELRLKQIKKQALNESPAHEQGSSHETPVFPLDYGGFSEERIREHQDLSVIVDLSDYQAGSVTYEPVPAEESEDNADEDLYIEPTEREAQQDGHDDKNGIRRVADEPETMSFDSLVRRSDVVRFDAHLPKELPEPKAELVKKGKFYFKPPTKDSFQDYCYMYRKNSRILDQPSSTYVSVTAKGVDIEKYIDLSSPVPGISNLEPICPDPKRTPLPAFGRLPAYVHREALKFYKPEKALKDALLTLGHDKESMEHVAARLYLAISAAKDGGDSDVHWSVTTAASLYWRVKGDAANAIRCLRHSLNSSPKEMRDVAMVSLASIYLQAGFAHSALVMGGEALKISPDSVVAIHFTLANIYASVGDFQRALMFYYSTVTLQSNFQPAKDRIRAIYCQSDKIINV